MLKAILSSLFILAAANSFAESGHDDHDDHKEEKLDGFELNFASTKTFEIKLIKYTSQKMLIPGSAIYKGLNEVNIYRFRAGLYKRIDFKSVSKTKSDYLITSNDLTDGDQVVTNGVGFLRMAEIAASGGLSDSHSH